MTSDPQCDTNGHRYQSNCYQFHLTTKAVTWHQAEEICQQQQGHLVSIMNKQEMTFVHFLLTTKWRTSHTRTYIGLTDADQEGLFHWIDGRPMVYTAW